jgi:hypothetical protein
VALAAAADAAPKASVAASASGPTRPFDPAAAHASLDALTAKLVDCKIPKGGSGRIKLLFQPDGRISSTDVLAPFVGTPEGACVASHLKKAHVPPFVGRATPYVYTFVVPHSSPERRK